MPLPRMDVYAPEFADDQDQALEAARNRHPYASSDRGTEILGYPECQSLLRDRRAQKDHLAVVERVGITDPDVLAYKRRVLVGQGLNAERDRMRSVLSRAISPRQMDRLRGETRTLVHTILDGVPADRPVDFVHEVASLVPSMLFCQWAGLPTDDARLVSDLSDVMLKIFWLDPAYTERIEAAYRKLFTYMDGKLADLRPGGDTGFLAHLAREQEAGNVRPDEVRDWVIFALEGSTDNTVHQIALLLGRLLETPDLWRRVRADPELVEVVTEESMRLDSRTRAIHRQAADDIEVPGGTIKSGSDMFFWIRAAHLDPRVFDDPREFVVGRPRSPGPLMYGRGPYSCLGQWMARMEVQETLRAVIERFPGIRLSGTPRRSIDLFSLSADDLPVVLAP